jgi:hypothetical protein
MTPVWRLGTVFDEVANFVELGLRCMTPVCRLGRLKPVGEVANFAKLGTSPSRGRNKTDYAELRCMTPVWRLATVFDEVANFAELGLITLQYTTLF